MKSCRNPIWFRPALLLAVSLVPLTAWAGIRDKNVCPSLGNDVDVPAGRVVEDVCYSGFRCTVGLRGDWLDLTDRVSIGALQGQPFLPSYPRVSIGSAGADPQARDACVPPSNKTREGYVAIEVQDIAVTGGFKLTVHRPGMGGITRDSNEMLLTIRDGTRFFNPLATASGPASVPAGIERIVELRGRGLDNVRLKPGIRQPFPPATSGSSVAPPRGTSLQSAAAGLRANVDVTARSSQALSQMTFEPAPFEVVSARYDVVRLKVKILRPGLVSLGDYLEFAAGDPAINRDLGWPQIEVR